MSHRLVVVLCLAFATSCAHAPVASAPADLVVRNARVFTGEASQPWATALAVRGERIIAVGGDEVARLPARRVFDAAGRLLVPGLNDAHVHEPDGEGWGRGVPLAGVTDAAGVLRAIAVEAQAGGADGISLTVPPPLTGDPAFTREALDAAAPETPVRLGVIGGHAALLNTAALRRAGLSDTTPDAPGGRLGRRDGKLDGWLFEHALWSADVAVAKRSTDEALLAELNRFVKRAVRYGITSAQSMPMLGAARIAALLPRLEQPLRLRLIPLQLMELDAAPRGAVKYVLDGTPLERGAAMREPYTDDTKGRGALNYTPAQLRRMVELAAAQDAQLLVHIAGDEAVHVLFDALDMVPADWPRRRLRLEHGDFVGLRLADAARHGVVLVQNPSHLTLRPVMEARFGARTKDYQRLASAVRQGVPLALGSDGPLNPWLNLMWATTHPQDPAEALTREEAMAAYTLGAAYAEFAEQEKGTLRPGKLADFAVLSQDVFTAPAAQLPATESILTVIGGKVVYEATPAP